MANEIKLSDFKKVSDGKQQQQKQQQKQKQQKQQKQESLTLDTPLGKLKKVGSAEDGKNQLLQGAGSGLNLGFSGGTLGPAAPVEKDKQPKQEEESGVFLSNVQAGIQETGGLAQAGVAALSQFGADIAETAGFEDTEKFLESTSDEFLQGAAEQFKQAEKTGKGPSSIEEVDNPSEFIDWAAGVLGRQAPVIAGALASGGLGAIAGGAAKSLAKKAGKELTQEQIEKKAKKLGVEEFTKEAVEKGAKDVAKRRGATAGTAAFGTTVETGGIFQEQQESKTAEESPGTALLFGATAGLLETLPFIQVARRLGLGKQAKDGLLKAIDEMPRGKRALATSALVSGTEAGTETLQEALAVTARDVVDENFQALDEKSASRLINAAAAGAVAGGVTGGVAGAVGPGEEQQEGGLPQQERSTTEPTQAPQQGGFEAQPAAPIPPVTSPQEEAQQELSADAAAQALGAQKQPDLLSGVMAESSPGFAEDVRRFVDSASLAPSVPEGAPSPEFGTNQPKVVAIDESGKGREVDLDSFLPTPTDEVAPDLDAPPEVPGEVQENIDEALPEAEGQSVKQPGERGIKEEFIDATEQATGTSETVEQETGAASEEFLDAELSIEEQLRREEQRQELRRRVGTQRQTKEAEPAEELTQEEVDRQVDSAFRRLGLDPDEDAPDIFESRTRRELTPEEFQARNTLEHTQQVRSEVNEIRKQFKGFEGVQFVVQRSADYGNDALNAESAVRRSVGNILSKGNASGLYVSRMPDQGNAPQVHIASDKIPTKATERRRSIERLMAHEAVVHGGLDTIFNEQEKESFRKLVAEKAEGTEAWNEVQRLYAGQSDFVQAEEYVARIAEEGTQMGLLRRVIAKVKQALRRIFGNDSPFVKKVTQDEIRQIISDIRSGLETGDIAKAREALKPYVAESGRSYRERAARDIDNLMMRLGQDDEQTRQQSEDIDNLGSVWGTEFSNMFLTPLQIAERYNVEPMQRYYKEDVPRWWVVKQEILDVAEQTRTQMQKLGKRKLDTLARMIFRATLESDKQQRKLSTEELIELWKRPDGVVQKKSIEPDQELIDVFAKVRESIDEMLERFERGLKRDTIRQTLAQSEQVANQREVTEQILRIWEENARQPQTRLQQIQEVVPGVFGEELTFAPRLREIESDFAKLRNRNYFPLMRFGKFSVSAVATRDTTFDGEQFEKGQPVIFETYEGVNPQQSRKKELAEQFKGRDDISVHAGQLDDAEFNFTGLPPSLFQSLKGKLDLNKQQEQDLRDIFRKLSPGKSFLKHLLQRKGTQGFSEDLMRVFSSYMTTAAGHLARVENATDMQEAIQDMEDLSRDMRTQASTTDSTVVDKLKSGMQEHFEWIMNPRNELAGLRSFGFMWYLGFNPRSAIVNLTQIPMVTYPYLAERYGDTKALRDIFVSSMRAASRSPKGRPEALSSPIDRMLREGALEGWVDESLATEIAGYAEGDVMQRFFSTDRFTRFFNKFTYYGSWMFSHAEQFNRRAAAIAAYKLAVGKKLGKDITDKTEVPEEAHQFGLKEAREAVQKTQFEYAKWNRPKFMRGKRSVFFLFWQYMQHASFLAAGGEGKGTAMRFWLMLGLAAGLQGLPFAETIFDLIDAMGRKFKEMMGLKDPRVDLREDLRGIAKEMGANPDMVMHGMTRYYGLGPLHALSVIGAPVPNVDISGSLSLGRFPPGISPLLKGEGGRGLTEASGALFSLPVAVWKTFQDDNPDEWKRWERVMPTVLKNVSEAVRYKVRGEETTESGAQLIEFDPLDKKHQAEIIAEALGFPSTRKQKALEEKFALLEAKRYWSTKRTLLMQDFEYARFRDDREYLADVRKAIREFNKNIPSPALAITSDNLKQSVEGRIRRRQLEEQGIPNEKMFRPLFRDLEKVY